MTSSSLLPTAPRSARNCASTSSLEEPMAATLRSSASVARPNPGRPPRSDGDHVAQEGDPVAVRGLQAVPEHASVRPPGEVTEQRGLAVAGLRRNEDDAGVPLLVEPAHQPRPRQDAAALDRRRDLAGDDGQPGGMARSRHADRSAACRWMSAVCVGSPAVVSGVSGRLGMPASSGGQSHPST